MSINASEAKNLLETEAIGGSRTAIETAMPDIVFADCENEKAKFVVAFPDGMPADIDPAAGLSAIDATKESDLPKRTVSGKERVVNKVNYLRRLRKEHTELCCLNTARHIEALVRLIGYPDADVVNAGPKLVVYLEGVPVGDIVNV